MKKTLLALTAATLISTPAFAETETFEFDKTHTNIMWFASHGGFSDSMGQFMDYDGKIILDENSLENSSVTIDIKTASMMTGLPKFDKHLKSPDFFDIEKHPIATFKSVTIKEVEENKLEVTGDFTMLGVTKPLTINATVNKIGENPFNNVKTMGVSAETVIKRSDFGMNYGIDWGISDDVKIKIELEAHKAEK